MLNFTTDSKNLYCTGGYFFRNFAGGSLRRKILLILLIIFSSFSSYSIAGIQEKQDIPRMVQRSDLIIRGKVISTASQWKEDSRGRHIYTSVTVKILDKIKGNIKDDAFAFEVVGGTVDDIREVVSGTPAFEVDEDAILFLAGDPLAIQHGINGKILIYDGRVYLDGSEATADSFIQTLKILGQDPNAPTSLEGKYPAPTEGVEAAQCYIYSGYKWPGTSPIVSYKINQNTSDCYGEGTAVQTAANSWNSVGANFTFQYGGSCSSTDSSRNYVNEIMWGTTEDADAFAETHTWVQNGVIIVECDIVFNDPYFDWSTKTTPYSWEADVQTVALHEFGHWLSLDDLYDYDDRDNVMYGYTRDVKRALQPCDIAGICYIYGGCPCSIDVTSPSSTSNWDCGQTYTIRWTSVRNPSSYVKIQLYKGSSLVQTITSSTYDGGSYSWTVSSSLVDGSDYRIKVSSTLDSSCYDYSSYFEITCACVRVTSPSSSSVWECNRTYPISWSRTPHPTDMVDIWLTKGGGWWILERTEDDGSYSWTVPTWLEPDCGYWVMVRSTLDSSCYGESDTFCVILSPPNVPTGVSASDGTYCDRVQVSWNDSSGATSYEIWRYTSNNSGSASKIADDTASPYDDTSAAAGTTYWYWVKAKNSGGTSGFSNGDSGYRVITPPDAPILHEEPNITPGLCNKISWDTVPEAKAYYAECSSDPNFLVVDYNSGWITGTSYQFCDLTFCQEYWYSVKSGLSAWSQASQANFETDTLTDTIATSDGNVVLAGGGGIIFQDDFEDGNYNGWIHGTSSCTRQVTNETAAAGTTYSFTQTGPCSSYQGVHYTFAPFTPDRVTFYVRTESTEASGYVVLVGSDTSHRIVWFYMSDNIIRVYQDTTYGTSCNLLTWYKVDFVFNWQAKTFAFYVDDGLIAENIPFRDQGVNSFETIYLHDPFGTQSWWDEIEFSTGSGGGYTPIGDIVSTAIDLPVGGSWDVVDFNTTTPADTELTVDILPAAGSTPITGYENVSSGTDLGAIGDTIIRLRANLSTNDPNSTPALHDWSVTYADPAGIESDWSNIESSIQVIPGDFEPDCDVDWDDLAVLTEQWLLVKLSADVWPDDGDGIINLLDLAVFANAWQSTTSSPNWNPKCDIAPQGGNGIVDIGDLAVFTEQWLQFGAYNADIAPLPDGDGIVDFLDFAILANHWLEDTTP